jgi:Ca-activated chloride channel family protein
MLDVVAKDVKVQVAFDPAQVQSYRLIGYENREVADVDFRNDAVDGGEVGRGHSVTALYDVVLRPFQSAMSGPAWATAHIRYKSPAGSAPASEASFPLESHRIAPGFDAAPESLRFASAVAAFAEILRESPHAKSWKLSELERIATGASEGRSERQELVGLVRRASASRGRR